LLLVMVLVGWFSLNMVSAKVSRQLPMITIMIESDPAAAEAALAQVMQRRPLMRGVRLMLYHRLALMRHRQRRYAESALICQTLLTYRLGAAEQTRCHMLLMLAEARLECGDMLGTFFALSELYRMPLSLIEALQRLALQTRYEVTAGHFAAAIHHWRQKLAMAEIMPAWPCGMMHVMLATAAQRAGQSELAAWLDKRSRLLIDRESSPDADTGFVTTADIAAATGESEPLRPD
jgi:hypothetical protein